MLTVLTTGIRIVFSCYALIWGWATWKDRKKNTTWFQRTCGRIPRYSENTLVHRKKVNYWKKFSKKILKRNSWARIWMLTNWHHEMLCCTPSVNLIENIGFSDKATHTVRQNSRAFAKTEPLPKIDGDILVKRDNDEGSYRLVCLLARPDGSK